MLVFFFCAMLVGLPMAIGVHAVAARLTTQDVRIGVAAIAYAVILAGVFVLILPEGKNLTANFQLKMPAALAVGGVIGLASGITRRARKE